MSARPPAIAWFRRDLRLADNPMLAAAGAGATEVVGLFVVDPTLVRAAGTHRRGFLAGCLAELRETTGGALVVRHGDPVDVVAELVAETGAGAVHVSEDFGPYGRVRDTAAESRLRGQGVALRRTGSPYAVPPGTLANRSGLPFRVFSPYSRAWAAHGWAPPAGTVDGLRWATGVRSEDPRLGGTSPAPFPPGERAASERLERFLAVVDDYHEGRDRPDLDGTSRLSPYLKFGCLHPRQVLDVLGPGPGPAAVRTELCWREFHADVLFHEPASGWEPLRPGMAALRVDEGPEADARFEAWAQGRTGYPLVDAGMRQLRAEGWMPNRVRMVAASFLVKDLHLPWQRGAREFLRHLVDGDLASNNHGWQWTAGTGTDSAPYHRLLNPTLQGRRFDPGGDYVHLWVPELAALPAPEVHEPWRAPSGSLAGYPAPVVDHRDERAEALARFAAIRA